MPKELPASFLIFFCCTLWLLQSHLITFYHLSLDKHSPHISGFFPSCESSGWHFFPFIKKRGFSWRLDAKGKLSFFYFCKQYFCLRRHGFSIMRRKKKSNPLTSICMRLCSLLDLLHFLDHNYPLNINWISVIKTSTGGHGTSIPFICTYKNFTAYYFLNSKTTVLFSPSLISHLPTSTNWTTLKKKTSKCQIKTIKHSSW